MISLLIDNKEVDFETTDNLSISLLISSITELDSSSTGYTKTISLPMTHKNRKVLGDCDQINSINLFNQQNHTASIIVDGFCVMEGQVMMSSIAREKSSGTYNIIIVGSSRLWVANASSDMINEINIDFDQKISADMIEQSWTWDSPVRMLPVMRDEYFIENSNRYAYVAIRIFSCRDYHPFLHVKTLLESIMQNSGYSIVSNFINTEYFDSLYISGAYSNRDVNLIKSKMDFKAGVFEEKTATANPLGRIYASPGVAVCSIGNIVDTADPNELSDGDSGSTVDGVYNIDNCFYKYKGYIVFSPCQEVTVSFELDINYLTEYYMSSRSQLKGFNQIYLNFSQNHTFTLSNCFVDRRGSIVTGFEYMLIAFDHQEGNKYKLTYTLQTDSGEIEYSYGTFSSRTMDFSLSADNSITDVRLYVLNTNNQYVEYTDDWAIYDGSVSETGTIEVQACIRSQSEVVSPSNPKYFHGIYFGGAEEGMRLTVLPSTKLRPIFSAHPGLGDDIEFSDVAQHEFRQIALINGIKHLFDLCFYTDSKNKEVYIEPRKSFFDENVIVDWSDRIDLDREIKISEFGSELNRNINIDYQDGDGTVNRWNEDNKDKFGQISYSIDNVFAKTNDMNYLSPVFHPTLNTSEVFADAPSSIFIQVGDREIVNENEDLNFPMKIVRYMGMKTLPDNECWGWPSYAREYPLVGFHSSEQGIGSLCFEDRDDMEGLHTYYDDTIDIFNQSKRVSLYLNLKARDIEPLIAINKLGHDFRALYRLKIAGESALYYLEQICDFNPSSGSSTLCIFIKKV